MVWYTLEQNNVDFYSDGIPCADETEYKCEKVVLIVTKNMKTNYRIELNVFW